MTCDPRRGSDRDDDLLEVELPGLLRLGRHLLVAGEPGLGLGLAALGVAAHPFEFVGQPLGELLVLLALDVEPLGLLLQVGRVVALVRVEVAAVDLGDPLGDVVEEVPIVGHGEHGAGVLGQVLLQPEHALGVQVVGGLVEQQQVGLLQQQPGERDPALFAAGEGRDVRVAGRGAQRIHRLLELGVEVPGVGGVDLLLQGAHLGQQRVEVGVRLGHRQPDRGVPVDLGLDLADALLHVLEHGLGSRRARGSCMRMPTV